MSLVLTQLGGDNFQYADVSPLPSPPWIALSTSPLQVVDELCEATKAYPSGSELFAGVSLPGNQYASATFVNLSADGPDGGPSCGLYARSSIDESFYFNGYQMGVANLGTGWGADSNGYVVLLSYPNSIADTEGITLNANDVWTLTAIGTTITVLQNGVVILSIKDTKYSSGRTGLNIDGNAPSFSGDQVSNFVCGSAAHSGSISGKAGIAGAILNYSGTDVNDVPVSGSVLADENGNYSIPDLNNGTYTVTPVLAGFAFTPTSQTVTVGDDPISGVNFTVQSTGSIGAKIPLPFTKRTTAAVTTFACLQQAKFAQTLTTNATTIGTLVTEQHNLFVAYRKLLHQDTANQAVTLNNAIGLAQAAINALNRTVQGMSLPVPPPDNVDTLVNIQAVVANAVQVIANVVADE